ncbi:hypothetical protein Syun_006713 [Stephania yunnanensis]|uniref:Uncharacterized protein n=1 Tax=Stephania yunnanensis TaxID=152371 RepID=A0AAP0PXT6_9MAGN
MGGDGGTGGSAAVSAAVAAVDQGWLICSPDCSNSGGCGGNDGDRDAAAARQQIWESGKARRRSGSERQ